MQRDGHYLSDPSIRSGIRIILEMRFRASNSYDFYRPSKCERRVALHYRGVPEAEKSEFEELLFRLGKHHEKSHLGTLTEVVDLSSGDHEARERDTLATIRAGAQAIYQARFRASVDLDGEGCELVGEPDFLIREGGGYRIRDSKLASHPKLFPGASRSFEERRSSTSLPRRISRSTATRRTSAETAAEVETKVFGECRVLVLSPDRSSAARPREESDPAGQFRYL